jgi:hypothetical protein
MSRASSCRFAVGAIVIFIAITAVVLVYVHQLSEADVQRLGKIGTAIAAVAGFLGFIVLVVYTRETFLLRLAAEEQNEINTKPVLRFDLSTKEVAVGEEMKLANMDLKNVGAGPAFNVKVMPILGDGVKMEVEEQPELTLIEAKGQVDLKFLISQDGIRSGMSGRDTRLMDLIKRGKFPAKMPVTVEYNGLSRDKLFRTLHEIRYEAGAKRLRTSFCGLEEVKRQWPVRAA